MTARTRLEELTDAECRRLLAAHAGRIGRLSIASARPVIFPVNYVMDGDDPVFGVAPDSRLAAAVAGQFVAFEIDEVNAAWREGWSVLVRGKAILADDESERTRLSNLGLRSWAPGNRDLYVRIRADMITGRRITDS